MAVGALIVGLSLSDVVPIESTYGIQLGEPLLLQFFAWMIFGPIPEAYDIVLHPVGFAAWFGLFVTALNLIPLGQLDGGHVVFAMIGERQRTLAYAIIPILLALGFWGWPGWIVWGYDFCGFHWPIKSLCFLSDPFTIGERACAGIT